MKTATELNRASRQCVGPLISFGKFKPIFKTNSERLKSKLKNEKKEMKVWEKTSCNEEVRHDNLIANISMLIILSVSPPTITYDYGTE